MIKFSLEIPAPMHLWDNIPHSRMQAIVNGNGHIGQFPHVSLGAIYLAIEQQELIEELYSGLANIFKENPLHKSIQLEPFSLLSMPDQHYSMSVKSNSIMEIEIIYNLIIFLVERLQKRFSDEYIQMEKWQSYDPQVSLFEQLPEPLYYDDNISYASPSLEFIPTCFRLRNNNEIVKIWEISSPYYEDKTVTEVMKLRADLAFQNGCKEYNAYANGQDQVYEGSQNQFIMAERNYKNIDDLAGRIQCLIALGSLNESKCLKNYAKLDDKVKKTRQAARVEIIKYAMAVAHLLLFMPDNLLSDADELWQKSNSFLQKSPDILLSFSKKKKILESMGIEYTDAVMLLAPTMAQQPADKSKNCYIM